MTRHHCQLYVEDKSHKARLGFILLTWCNNPAYDKMKTDLGWLWVCDSCKELRSAPWGFRYIELR